MQTVTIEYKKYTAIMNTNDLQLQTEWLQAKNKKYEQYKDEIDHIKETLVHLEKHAAEIHNQQIKLNKEPISKFFSIKYYQKQHLLNASVFNTAIKIKQMEATLRTLYDRNQMSKSELEQQAYKLMTKHGYYLHQRIYNKSEQSDIWHKK